MENTISAILTDFCSDNGIPFSSEKAADFEKFCDMLMEFNSHTNLTAIKDREGIAIKHFADSLAPLTHGEKYLPKGARIADIGCGAGFPGLPLALMRDDISVTFVDSTAKKLKFTESIAEEFMLNAECIAGRAEELAASKERRECYDVVVSRAVASLPVLCELCLPFVKVGGTFIAYKAVGASEELEGAKKAIPALGGKYIETVSQELPECGGEALLHSLIIIKKVSATSAKYPRRYAVMLKSPL